MATGIAFGDNGQKLTFRKENGGVTVSIENMNDKTDKKEFFIALPAQLRQAARTFMNLSKEIDAEIAEHIQKSMNEVK